MVIAWWVENMEDILLREEVKVVKLQRRTELDSRESRVGAQGDGGRGSETSRAAAGGECFQRCCHRLRNELASPSFFLFFCTLLFGIVFQCACTIRLSCLDHLLISVKQNAIIVPCVM